MYDVTNLKNLLVNENGFAFDPATGFTYNLSLTALGVLRRMKEGRPDDEILDWLADAHEVEKRRAARDLETFVSSLVRYGLIHSSAGEDGP